MPSPLRVISIRVSFSKVPRGTRGMAWSRCMMSSTCSSRRRPRVPAGWERAKSSRVKPRLSSKATARASPMARAAVVLAVGARPKGQASSATLTSMLTSAPCARVERGFPVKLIRGTPRRLISGRIRRISSVSPELDRARTRSSGVIIPRSPWLASPGWTKKAGLPVLARVAAILPAMCPDLPMPRTTMRPRQPSINWQARAKPSSRRSTKASTALASVSRTARPRARIFSARSGLIKGEGSAVTMNRGLFQRHRGHARAMRI